MPMYDYKCEKCGTVQSDIVPYDNRNDPIACKKCSGDARYQIPSPKTIVRWNPWAEAIRKDQIDFKTTSIDESIKKMKE